MVCYIIRLFCVYFYIYDLFVFHFLVFTLTFAEKVLDSDQEETSRQEENCCNVDGMD